MAKKRSAAPGPSVMERVLEAHEASVLDVLDHVLEKGVMTTGDLTLGVAGIDLIYVRLGALLCAADRVLPPLPDESRRKSRSTAKPRRSRRARSL